MTDGVASGRRRVHRHRRPLPVSEREHRLTDLKEHSDQHDGRLGSGSLGGVDHVGVVDQPLPGVEDQLRAGCSHLLRTQPRPGDPDRALEQRPTEGPRLDGGDGRARVPVRGDLTPVEGDAVEDEFWPGWRPAAPSLRNSRLTPGRTSNGCPMGASWPTVRLGAAVGVAAWAPSRAAGGPASIETTAMVNMSEAATMRRIVPSFHRHGANRPGLAKAVPDGLHNVPANGDANAYRPWAVGTAAPGHRSDHYVFWKPW